MVDRSRKNMGGALCGTVELNRYEVLTAICRAAAVKAGLPPGGDFGIDEDVFAMPERMTFRFYDGYAMVVVTESTPADETDEEKHARQVRNILRRAQRDVVKAFERQIEGRIQQVAPVIDSIVRSSSAEEVEAKLGQALRDCESRGILDGDDELDMESIVEKHYREACETNDTICTKCSQRQSDTPYVPYCPKGFSNLDSEEEHSQVLVASPEGRRAFLRRLQRS